MDHTDTPAGTSIRARVHPRALDRMPMFFDASVRSAFLELIANARRSGATRVDIHTEPLGPPKGYRFEVTVRDDGHGIADPAVLLSFGESAWNDKLTRSENAAGMGLLCLAKRGCAVSSRPRLRSAGGLRPVEGLPAWRVKLDPDRFTGKRAAAVLPDDTAPEPHGTCVTFVAEQSLDALRGAAAGAAFYAPLPVTFDGAELKREDFLKGSIRIEQWRGLTLGVRKSRQPAYNEPDIDFHGLTVNVRLPHVQTLDGASWTVRAKIRDCPELELVLPARKEAVESAFLQKLRDEARLAIYRALAPLDPPPRIAFDDHTRAARAGIDLPVPRAELWPWTPSTADMDDWTRHGSLGVLPSDALVVEYDSDPPEIQPFHRAARRAGLAPRLFQPERRLVGYAWYDAMARLSDVRTEIEIDGATYTVKELHRRVRAAERNGDADADPRPEGSAPQGDRAHAISMRVEITQPDGNKDFTRIPADVVFLDTEYGWLSDSCPVIAADSDIGAEELAELLRRAYFCPSDDAEADSYSTQSDQFNDAAQLLALEHVASADEATRTAITQAVWREIHWLMPKNRTVNIAVHGNDVSVDLGPLPEA